MDLAMIIGVICGWAIIIVSMMLAGNLGMFADVPSVLIVLVGSVFVVMMKFTLGQTISAGKVAAKSFIFKMDSPEDVITQVVELANVARKGGLLSLEGKPIPVPFLAKGIQLLIDGHDAEVVRSLMSRDKSLAVDRHKSGSAWWAAFGDVGPAMGMIGTLVGLVAMLANMSDPKAIGPAMAVALLTTLYGAMLSNMLCLPIADKLRLRMAEEELLKSMIIDGVLAIQAGQNPRVIESVLRTYLPEGKRGNGSEA